LGKLLYPVLGHAPFDKEANQKALDDAKKAFKILDHHLSTNTHLVGKTTTIADIAIVSSLWYPFKFLFEANHRKGFAHLTKFFEARVAEPAFVQVWGITRLCVKQLNVPHVHIEESKQVAKKEEKKS